MKKTLALSGAALLVLAGGAFAAEPATTLKTNDVKAASNYGWINVAQDSDNGALPPQPTPQPPPSGMGNTMPGIAPDQSTQPAQTPSQPGPMPDQTAPGQSSANSAAGATAGLDTVSSPETTLKSAAVHSSDGKSVGTVANVETDTQGKAQSVDVKVGGFLGIGGKTVSIAANELSYDPAKKIVVAQLTEDEINALPKVQPAQTSSAQ